MLRINKNRKSKSIKHFTLLILFTFFSNNSFCQQDTIPKSKKIEERPKSENVSIISLIANPEKYYGKRITVTGYMSCKFEGTAIYLSRDDFDHGINKNAIFLLFAKLHECQYYHKEYVTLDGIFIKGGGHFGTYSGMLKDVAYITKFD